MSQKGLRVVDEFTSLRDGFQKSPCRPFVVRHAKEFLNTSYEDALERFKTSNDEVFGYDDAGNYVEGLLLSNLTEQWLADGLRVKVLDSPMHVVDLPLVMDDVAAPRSNAETPEAGSFASQVYAHKHGQSPVLTCAETYTPFHVDPPSFGGGWMYLWKGNKTWHFLSQAWITTLIQTSTGEIQDAAVMDLRHVDPRIECFSVTVGGGDFVYFPPGWIHRVWTHEKSLGIGGYIQPEGAMPEFLNAMAQLEAPGKDFVLVRHKTKICLLTNQDLDADPFVDAEPPCDPRPYLPEATWHVAVLRKATAVEQVAALASDGYDLFFNLCDGAADDDTTPGIEVVLTLEELGLPFTGATPAFYEPSREQMKQACRAAGIATPAYVISRNTDDVEQAAATLRFPLFVKHWSSYSSIGLSRASRVQTPEELRREARKVMSRFGAALIEEYIEGLECTVLVAENPSAPTEPTTYTPLEYRFPDGESFKHEALKWIDWRDLKSFPVEDPALAARLRNEAAQFFLALNGTSFGRCDVRVDRDGTPFWLEINPNCGVYYPKTAPGGADLILLHDPAGLEGFTRQIVAAAMARHAATRRDEKPD